MTVIDVLVFDGCEALDALGPHEVLAHGGLDVCVVTRDEARSVRTSQGLELKAEAPRDGAEWLVVPGGAWDARRADPNAEAARVPSVPSRAATTSEAANWPRSAPARCGLPTPD